MNISAPAIERLSSTLIWHSSTRPARPALRYGTNEPRYYTKSSGDSSQTFAANRPVSLGYSLRRWYRVRQDHLKLCTDGGTMMRRSLLSRLASLPFFALGATQAQAQAPPKKLKIMMKRPTRPERPTTPSS